MEEEDEIKQSHQQEESKEEKCDKQDEISQEDKISPTLEERDDNGDEISIVKQALESHDQQEDTKEEKTDKQDHDQISREDNKISPILEERQDNGDEIISIQKQALEADHKAGKVGEIQSDSLKKPKQGLKQQNQKSKLTVPQPFSLATERRMSRERRAGSMDFRESTPKLSKSISLNYKVNGQSSVGAEGTSNQRHANSATSIPRISSRPRVPTSERIDKRVENVPKTKDKIQVKEFETKKAQANAKKQETEELEIRKFRKSSTFKASPLPSFYHRKDHPPKPEIKKIPATRPRSPLLGQRSKSVQNSEHRKTEEKGKVPDSEVEEKTEEKGKGVSRTISKSAKEAITKLFRTARKPPKDQKVTVKGVISTA